MVINLLNNAIKFTDSGSVTVNEKQENDQLVISVSDTGKGISEDEIDTIFDEYRQVKGSVFIVKIPRVYKVIRVVKPASLIAPATIDIALNVNAYPRTSPNSLAQSRNRL